MKLIVIEVCNVCTEMDEYTTGPKQAIHKQMQSYMAIWNMKMMALQITKEECLVNKGY